MENMDQRLFVKIGKEMIAKKPCVGECGGCEKQFSPVPEDEGRTFCTRYIDPSAMWSGLNSEGKPKTCPVMHKPKTEEQKKVNPMKASKRGISQAASQVAAATGSKEATKKN